MNTTQAKPIDTRKIYLGPVPQLFLRKGRKLVEINLEQCDAVMRAYIGDRCYSEIRKPWIDLHTVDGEIFAHISYNGRVWYGKNGTVERKEIEVQGVETCASLDARGWHSPTLAA